MKRLQLPKNKFARIFITIVFFILWAKLITFLMAPWGTIGKIFWESWELDVLNIEHRRNYYMLSFFVQWIGFIGGSIYLWTRKPKKERITKSKD